MYSAVPLASTWSDLPPGHEKCSLTRQSGFRKKHHEWNRTQQWAEKDCTFLFFFLVTKSFCTPSAAPCMQRTPLCITAVTFWNITSCLLSALSGSGWQQNPRKCDLHFLNRWKININHWVWKRQNPDRIGGRLVHTLQNTDKGSVRTADRFVLQDVTNLRGICWEPREPSNHLSVLS